MIIESSSLCNLKCAICPTGTSTLKRAQGMIKQDNFRHLVDEAGPYLRYLNLYFCGEPLMHKKICEIIEYAKKKGIEQVQLHTNGNMDFDNKFIQDLVTSGLDLLVVSIDGATQDVYEKYRRGGSLAKSLNFIKKISAEKRESNSFYPKVEIQFILMQHNYKQLDQMKRIVRNTDADSLQLKLLNPNMAKINLDKKREFLPQKELLDQFYAKVQASNPVDLTQRRLCSLLWDSAVITWDGLVLPCCNDTDASVILGSLFNGNRFREIWNGARYRNFRMQVQHQRRQIPLCRECPNT